MDKLNIIKTLTGSKWGFLPEFRVWAYTLPGYSHSGGYLFGGDRRAAAEAIGADCAAGREPYAFEGTPIGEIIRNQLLPPSPNARQEYHCLPE